MVFKLQVIYIQMDIDIELLLTGTEAWVYRLKIADQFSNAKKEPMEIDGIPQAFAKTAKTFQYYYILAAGHMVNHRYITIRHVFGIPKN